MRIFEVDLSNAYGRLYRYRSNIGAVHVRVQRIRQLPMPGRRAPP